MRFASWRCGKGMPNLGSEIVDQAFQAARLIAKAGADIAFLRQDIHHAECALHAALSQTDTRVALLERLSRAHASGQIPDSGYRNLVAAIARLLKASADLTAELARVTQSRGG
jgi:hypothetical protein